MNFIILCIIVFAICLILRCNDVDYVLIGAGMIISGIIIAGSILVCIILKTSEPSIYSDLEKEHNSLMYRIEQHDTAIEFIDDYELLSDIIDFNGQIRETYQFLDDPWFGFLAPYKKTYEEYILPSTILGIYY